MVLPSATALLFWLTIAVAFLFFTALGVGMILLFGYLGHRVITGDEE